MYYILKFDSENSNQSILDCSETLEEAKNKMNVFAAAYAEEYGIPLNSEQYETFENTIKIHHGESGDYIDCFQIVEFSDIADSNTISSLVEENHRIALNHGWWDKEVQFGTLIALCHGELSEALAEYRNGHQLNETYTGEKGSPEGIPIEFADTIIYIMDICGHYGIDLEKALLEKMQFNKTRQYRHGGKVI